MPNLLTFKNCIPETRRAHYVTHKFTHAIVQEWQQYTQACGILYINWVNTLNFEYNKWIYSIFSKWSEYTPYW
jgi:hypothetical protein